MTTAHLEVTPAQADAARAIVERNSARGRPTSDAIRLIATSSDPEADLEAARKQALDALRLTALQHTMSIAALVSELGEKNPAMSAILSQMQATHTGTQLRVLRDAAEMNF